MHKKALILNNQGLFLLSMLLDQKKYSDRLNSMSCIEITELKIQKHKTHKKESLRSLSVVSNESSHDSLKLHLFSNYNISEK